MQIVGSWNKSALVVIAPSRNSVTCSIISVIIRDGERSAEAFVNISTIPNTFPVVNVKSALIW